MVEIFVQCVGREVTMKGVQYYYDDKGEPIAVLIDLKKNPEIWEDFHDLIILEKRRNELTVPAEEVHAKLTKKRKVALKR